MANILKTEALVLRKLNFGDSSNIASFYTKDLGKISAIIKGARSSKSKIGKIADVLNKVEIVIYSKDSRDVQLVSQIDLVNHYPSLKNNLEKLKYASAVIELIDIFVLENETNDRLYRGTAKILDLINSGNDPLHSFAKYFIFFISEIGFELEIEKCRSCEKKLDVKEQVGFNFEGSFYCSKCSKDHMISIELSAELFDSLFCLSSKRIIESLNEHHLKKIVNILEKFLIYHMSEFKGLQSLKMF
jgi:DNA repair protein RecO (recombination protein O)